VSAGYDVTVYEARNRVGGRVISFDDFVPHKHVEGGGELIGSNHATWVAYKDRFKLEFLDVTEDKDHEAPIVLNGQKLSSEESDKLWEEMTAALNMMNKEAAAVGDPFQPWKTRDAEVLDRRTLSSWIQTLNVSPLCKTGIDTQMIANNGMRTEWQSWLGNLAMVKGGGLEKFWTDSEVYRCAGGNQSLAKKLLAAWARIACSCGRRCAASISRIAIASRSRSPPVRPSRPTMSSSRCRRRSGTRSASSRRCAWNWRRRWARTSNT